MSNSPYATYLRMHVMHAQMFPDLRERALAEARWLAGEIIADGCAPYLNCDSSDTNDAQPPRPCTT